MGKAEEVQVKIRTHRQTNRNTGTERQRMGTG